MKIQIGAKREGYAGGHCLSTRRVNAMGQDRAAVRTMQDAAEAIIGFFLADRRTMKHLEPKQTYEFLNKNTNAVFIDCRSEMEYLFVGHPAGALSVPWNDGPDWEVNPHFVAHVKIAASVDRPIVLICRSGNRSLDAGAALEKAGFTQVYNVLHGFEGELDATHHRNSVTGWRF